VSRTVCLSLICATLGSLLSGTLSVVALPNSPLLISQATARDYNKLGAERFARQDYRGAIAAYTEAIRLNPNDDVIYGNRGDAHAALANYPGVLADYTEAIRLNPKNADYYKVRADYRSNRKDYKGAITDYTEAIQLDPSYILAYEYRAYARFEIGEEHAGFRDLDEAVRIYSSNGNKYSTRKRYSFLGKLSELVSPIQSRFYSLFEFGYFQEALLDANQLVQMKNYSIFGLHDYCDRSKTYYFLEKYSQALADANTAIKLNPKVECGYQNRASAYIGLGSYQEAEKDLSQAMQMDKKNSETYYWRGLLQLKQGNNPQAIADYEEAVRLNPSTYKGRQSKIYKNYSLIARRQLETPVATPQPRPTPAAPPPVATAANSPAPNVYKIADQTTVLIQGQDSGSGVIISKVGNTYYVLTANHVVATQAQQQIVSPDGSKKYPLDYTHVKKLKNLDLAVVQFTSNESYPIAQLGSSEDLSQGDIIFVSGWPAVAQAITKATLQVTDGRISGFQKGDADGYEMLYTNATAPGMSGGPVFDSRGRVIGIHGRAAGNTNSGKVGINLGIPIHLFLQQAPQAGLNLQQLGLRAEK
jgi:tetratricopeptide (TPR) repeat protein